MKPIAVFKHFTKTFTQFGAKIKALRSDNGLVYKHRSFQEYLRAQRIVDRTSCVDTPAQNGVAERKNRRLLDVASSLLFTIRDTKTYWGDAVLTDISWC